MPNKKTKSSNPKPLKPRRGLDASVALLRRQAPLSEPYMAPTPRFRAKAPKEGCACYEGIDYVTAFNSSSAGVNSGLWSLITPTNSTLFPRLAAIADVYLKWRLKKLRLHLVGRSAATQAGTGAFSSIITDDATTGITLNTESIVKNSQGCLVIKGWESGVHEVDVSAGGLKWYNTDTTGTASPYLGGVILYIPQTTANNDLSWDFYIEYEIEFDEAVSGPTINLLREQRWKKANCHQICSPQTSEPEDIEDLLAQFKELSRKISSLSLGPS